MIITCNFLGVLMEYVSVMGSRGIIEVFRS